MRRDIVALLCAPLLFFSCASAPTKPTVSESNAIYAGVKLGRATAYSKAGLTEAASIFLTSDEGVTAQVDLEELRGEVEVRWDWIAPDEKTYLSVSRKAAPGDGMYYPRAALIHTLNIDREDASSRPGLWAVDIFVDGKLKESRKFNIEPGLTAIRSPLGAQDAKKWALVIGIEKYIHLPPVEFAASDARVAANYFGNILGVPERNVILLENEKATRATVTARLKDFLPHNLDADSVLYVYFAGHGMPEVSSGEPYLALFDSEATNVARTGYKLKEYLSDIGALNVRNAYVFTDACFSGMAARGDRMLVPGARPAVINVVDASLLTGKVVAMSASTGNQLSHAYHDKRHGLFTYYLLSGLNGHADADKDGAVSYGELFAFVKENVGRVSRRTAMEQVPSVTPRIENVADVKLVGPPAR